TRTRPATAPSSGRRIICVKKLTCLTRSSAFGAAAVLVIVFFFLTADRTMFSISGLMTIMAPASQLGILAIAAALLMIGGEFDVSIGSMVAFAG
ncbi:ABC transporter permease, partial [Rhizobium ruizarguesonis]